MNTQTIPAQEFQGIFFAQEFPLRDLPTAGQLKRIIEREFER